MAQLLSSDNPVFAGYLFYSAILILKTLAMAMLTGRQRKAKLVFANPEDAAMFKGKTKYDDPDVERVRRAHLNDLENILPFLVAGFLYTMTNPSQFLALMMFRAFTAARLLHTVVYAVMPLPQPSRAIAFFVGYSITGYMCLQTILTFL